MSDWRRFLMHPVAMVILAGTAGLMISSLITGRAADIVPQFFLGAVVAILTQRQLEIRAHKRAEAAEAAKKAEAAGSDIQDV